MKSTMLIAALLGVCVVQAFALRTVDVRAGEKVAFIKTEDGLNSMYTVLDYNKGVLATRLLSSQTCVVMMMNRAVIPALEQLEQGAQTPPVAQLSYSIMSTPVKQVAQFGSYVEGLCTGVPTHYAEETQRTTFAACEFIINIMGIVICTSITYC